MKGMRRRRKQPTTNYAFIDSQNLNQTIQRLGWKMDWRKFRQYLTDTYNVSHAYMFIGYVPEFESMYQQLHDWGYLIVLKPTYDMTRPRHVDDDTTDAKSASSHTDDDDKKEEKKTKGNVDADLVLWAMKELPRYNQAVIVSGDGDFYGLIEYLAEQKKLLKLLAPSGHYSRLYNTHKEFVERLDIHRGELRYHERPRSNKHKANSKKTSS